MSNDERELEKNVITYLRATQSINELQLQIKNLKETREKAKAPMLEIMNRRNVKYLEINGSYIIIRQTSKKQSINGDFIKSAFVKFVDDDDVNLDPNTRATRFVQFIFGLQDYFTVRTPPVTTLCISSKPPKQQLDCSGYNHVYSV
jgi:hypothetical protein